MSKTGQGVQSLDRLYHEPSRLALVSALLAAENGMLFNDLKQACGLTDGNLNRHLHVLEEAGAVILDKIKQKGRPLTRVQLTQRGRESFVEYLQALEAVLQSASLALDVRAATARTVSVVTQ